MLLSFFSTVGLKLYSIGYWGLRADNIRATAIDYVFRIFFFPVDVYISVLGFLFAEKVQHIYLFVKVNCFMDTRIEIKNKVPSPLYNHTLATILVEYASAVR